MNEDPLFLPEHRELTEAACNARCMPITPTSELPIIYIDIGTRNLDIIFMMQYGVIPPASECMPKLLEGSWKTAGPDGKPLMSVLGAYAIDLTPPGSSGPKIKRFETAVVKEMSKLAQLPKPSYVAPPAAPGELCLSVPTIRSALKYGIDGDTCDKKALKQINQLASYNLWSDRIAMLFADPSMAWIFYRPWVMAFEPQCDQVKNAGVVPSNDPAKKSIQAMVLARNFTVQQILRSIVSARDYTTFGFSRVFVNVLTKYGLKECWEVTKEREGIDDPYKLRKRSAVTSTRHMCRALGLYGYLAWLDELGKDDDACDVFAGGVAYMERRTRPKALTDKEIDKLFGPEKIGNESENKKPTNQTNKRKQAPTKKSAGDKSTKKVEKKKKLIDPGFPSDSEDDEESLLGEKVSEWKVAAAAVKKEQEEKKPAKKTALGKRKRVPLDMDDMAQSLLEGEEDEMSEPLPKRAKKNASKDMEKKPAKKTTLGKRKQTALDITDVALSLLGGEDEVSEPPPKRAKKSAPKKQLTVSSMLAASRPKTPTAAVMEQLRKSNPNKPDRPSSLIVLDDSDDDEGFGREYTHRRDEWGESSKIVQRRSIIDGNAAWREARQFRGSSDDFVIGGY